MELSSMRCEDLTGRTFGRLTVLDSELRRTPGQGKRYWLCLCECGTQTWVQTADLKLGHIVSCGCFRRAYRRAARLTHGHSGGTPTYISWRSMLARCRYRNGDNAHRYIKRGITVCDRWQKFENFLADMGERPPSKTLHRINNNFGYSPENCQWATASEQSRNSCRTKLTLDTAVEIVLRHLHGEKSSFIAKDYAVSERTVRQIAQGKRWKGAAIDAAFLRDLEEQSCA